MLRLVDIVEKTTDHIKFITEEISSADSVVYVVYDTSTGLSNLEDYYSWRAITVLTSTGSKSVFITIENSNIYPSVSTTPTDYSTLNSRLFLLLTFLEYQILSDVLIRLDLVRRRLPNPGYTLSSTNDIGQNGTVAFSGGFYKKMTADEIIHMMAGTIVEINATPPRTALWPMFQNINADKKNNPYFGFSGMPYEFRDLVTLRTVIR